MKINNYYSLPSVPCKSREELISSNTNITNEEKKQICENINANKVYNSLYPNGSPSGEYQPPEALENYYRNYKTTGKEGDYFCAYAYNKCQTQYQVGKNGVKIIPKESKNKKYVPPSTICLPPKCIPDSGISGNPNIKGVLKVNSNMELGCPVDNNGNVDEDCKKTIFKNSILRNTPLGFGSKYSSPNPPNLYLPYKKQYNEFNNIEVNNSILPVNDSSVPKPNGFKLNDECENWCYKSNDCNAVSYTYDNQGKLNCKYYNDKPYIVEQNLKEKIGNFVVVKPYRNVVNFNKEYKVQSEFEESEECCEGFTSKKDCPFSEEQIADEEFTNCAAILDSCMGKKKYGFCPKKEYSMCSNVNYGTCAEEEEGINFDLNISPTWSSNLFCSSLIKNCEDSKYGCCPDKITSKKNKEGTNCPVISKEKCINSKMGCCPGTITPREYLFKCPGKTPKEKEDCKIFANQLYNCELNQNLRGDPDAFRGKTCRSSGDCNHYAIGCAFIIIRDDQKSICTIDGIKNFLNNDENKRLFTLPKKSDIINANILNKNVDKNKKIKEYDFYFDGYEKPYELNDNCDSENKNGCQLSLINFCKQNIIIFFFLMNKDQLERALNSENSSINVVEYFYLQPIESPYVIAVISNEYDNFNSNSNVDFGSSNPNRYLEGLDVSYASRIQLIQSNFFEKNENKKFKKEIIYYRNTVRKTGNKNRTFCLFLNECSKEYNEGDSIDKAYLAFSREQWKKWKANNNEPNKNYKLESYSFVRISQKYENYQINKCINGFCVERNPVFYNNLLGGPKRAYKETKSGYSMLNYLPNVISGLPDKVIDDRYANCPSANTQNAGCSRYQAYGSPGSSGGSQSNTEISNNFGTYGNSFAHGDVVCPKTVEPVCGVNGITYKNGCMAKKHGVNVNYYGACKTVEHFSDKNKKYVGEYFATFILVVVGILIMILVFTSRKRY